MEFKFFADQSCLTLSIPNLPDTPVDKLAQDIATFLASPALLGNCAEKQKVWLEAHRWPVVETRLTNMMKLSPLPVAADG